MALMRIQNRVFSLVDQPGLVSPGVLALSHFLSSSPYLEVQYNLDSMLSNDIGERRFIFRKRRWAGLTIDIAFNWIRTSRNIHFLPGINI